MNVERLIAQVCESSAAAAVAQSGLRSPAAIRELRRLLGAPAGTPGSFLADPVIEGAFGYRESARAMSDLEDLLGRDLIDALDRDDPVRPGGERHRFARHFHPYVHQEESWRKLLGEEARSVLVSSGTGSGKTECFLIPILRHLLRTTNADQPEGVRALMLYPLNALIASQRDRLFDWTHPFGERTRFCLYNGLTPEEARTEERRGRPNEVIDRRTLRESPPPILVTNVTMLEYMLVRPDDARILSKSRGKLEWIVLDEAHSYVGSQAAELTLLLRRVMRGFGVKPGEVRFVATSATLSSGGDDARGVEAQLRRFLADLSGMDEDRVLTVVGERHVPDAASVLGAGEAFDELLDDEAAMRLRGALASVPALTATTLARTALGARQADAVERRGELLSLAERAARAKRVENAGTSEESATRFLPQRIHLVHRAQAGFWVCPNGGCAGRKGTELDDPSWPWGPIGVLERERCETCDTPLFELAACGECGAPHLLAEESGDGTLKRPRQGVAEDEFTQGVDVADPDEAAEDGTRRLIVPPDAEGVAAAFDPQSGGLLDTAEAGSLPIRLSRPEDAHRCAGCGSPATGGDAERFRRGRYGAPFLLSNALPRVLDEATVHKGADERFLPLDGRRLITFTDSRQGTARFAARLQQDGERLLARSVIYHAVQDGEASPEDAARLHELGKKIAQLEEALERAPDVIGPMLDDARAERVKVEGSSTDAAQPWARVEARLAEEKALEALREEAWAHRAEAGRFADTGEGRRNLARVLMLRELLRPPRRANSVETMGLAHLRFPHLRGAKVPAPFRDAGLGDEDWLDFLHAFATVVLRANGAVEYPRDDYPWLGVRFPRRAFAPPGEKVPSAERYVLPWPSVRSMRGGSTRIVKLLGLGLGLEPGKPAQDDRIEACLRGAFEALRPVLMDAEGGVRLAIERGSLARVDRGHLCPVSGHVLARPFRGLTPLQPPGRGRVEAPCETVAMPRHPRPFPRNADSHREVGRWLQEDDRVCALRDRNLWTDLHDRVARFASAPLAAEHSAQQPAWRLRLYEERFRAGRLNVLNCSTTMEMGVDIGGLDQVVNTNVPPSPANYRQRVGRAGRRGEGQSLALTFAKAEPHGWATYLNPLRPLETAIRPPRVVLDSATIVQRHVDALLLTDFLAREGSRPLHRLEAGAFLGRLVIDQPQGAGRAARIERSNACEAVRFVQWCERLGEEAERSEAAVAALVRGTCLEGARDLVPEAGAAMNALMERWRDEWDRLAADLDAVEGAAAKRRVRAQLRRLSRDYLLRVLAQRGFLPAHGFPTDLAPIRITDERDRRRDDGIGTGEARTPGESRMRTAQLPTRALAQAIRDYAPGTEVVLDGLVYRSAGVTPNWKRPDIGADALPQALEHAWLCRSCGGAGVSATRVERCSDCGSATLTQQEFLQPAGFAIERRQPHMDINRIDYVPPLPPFVTLSGAEWVPLGESELGRARSHVGALVLHRSRGSGGEGYALCLSCGRVEEGGENDADALRGHRALQGELAGQPCEGNVDGSFAIKRGISLAHAARTDAFELQLARLRGAGMEAIAWTLAVALREALARALGVEASEIGFAAEPRTGEGRPEAWSLILYDAMAGGAGFATQARDMLTDLLHAAADILDCPERCGLACSACVLTYDGRHQADKLAAPHAKRFLEENVLPFLNLAPERRFFGEASSVEMRMPLEALRTEIQKGAVTLFFAGDVGQWDPVGWSGLALLDRASSAGRDVRIAVDPNALRRLTRGQTLGLAALAARPGVSVHRASPPGVGGGYVLATGSPGANGTCVAWAAEETMPLGPSWPGTHASIIRGPHDEIELSAPLPLEEIRHGIGADVKRLRLTTELDRPIDTFGRAFWMAMGITEPGLEQLMREPVHSLFYTDRYLVTPLAIRLLTEAVTALPHAAGTSLSVRTTEIGNPRAPHCLHHGWSVPGDRDRVLTTMLHQAGFAATLEVGGRDEVAHQRSLVVQWADSEVEIVLDQGFGCWRTSRSIPFDFARPADAQVEALKNCCFSVECVSGGTSIDIEVRSAR